LVYSCNSAKKPAACAAGFFKRKQDYPMIGREKISKFTFTDSDLFWTLTIVVLYLILILLAFLKNEIDEKRITAENLDLETKLETILPRPNYEGTGKRISEINYLKDEEGNITEAVVYFYLNKNFTPRFVFLQAADDVRKIVPAVFKNIEGIEKVTVQGLGPKDFDNNMPSYFRATISAEDYQKYEEHFSNLNLEETGILVCYFP